jgi:F-box/WD-40 domain protein 7
MVRRSSNGSVKGQLAPSSFYCPISMELMSDPVVLATGHTYERVCIERWLQQGNRTCPVTGMRLRHLELTPNFALRVAVQASGFSALSIQLSSVKPRQQPASSCVTSLWLQL